MVVIDCGEDATLCGRTIPNSKASPSFKVVLRSGTCFYVEKLSRDLYVGSERWKSTPGFRFFLSTRNTRIVCGVRYADEGFPFLSKFSEDALLVMADGQ